MSHRILLVDPNLDETMAIERALVGTEHRVSVVARTFEEGGRQIVLDCPDLLIAAVRLEAFSGIHLLLRCRVDHPDLPVIIVGTVEDFTSDINRYGAWFQASPIERASLVRLVSDLLASGAPGIGSRRRWPRKCAELAAIVLETSVRVVDLGYGGLRLEIPGSREEIQGPLEVKFPTLGLSVTAVPRWLKPSADSGFWWCGAEIAAAGSDATRAWRWIVDSMN